MPYSRQRSRKDILLRAASVTNSNRRDMTDEVDQGIEDLRVGLRICSVRSHPSSRYIQCEGFVVLSRCTGVLAFEILIGHQHAGPPPKPRPAGSSGHAPPNT